MNESNDGSGDPAFPAVPSADARPDDGTASDPFDVALCQYELAGIGSVEALLDRADALLDRAGPADAYVLPELFAVDATAPGREELPVVTPSAFDRLAAWCGERSREHDALIVGGSAYVDGEHGVRNRAPVGTPDGAVRTYDKARPTPRERERGVVPGDGEPPVVDVGGVGVGVLVCYDVEFPALARATVDRGAEVLFVPSWTDGEAGYQRVARCCAARAVENQAGVAQVSVVGTRPGAADSEPTGRSAVYAPCDDVVGPHGTRLSLPRDEGAAATCRLDAGALRTAREAASTRPYADVEVFGG